MRGYSSIIAGLRKTARDQTAQEKAFVAFKVGLAVSLGTLLSLTPKYYRLWDNPFSLADQCIFTVLGGANLTVGGATEQLLWRFLIGASVGTAVFSGINALGGSHIAQGIVFFVVVFGLTLFRVKVFKADIGITFATLAAVYAVDDAYRGGNAYGVDTDALKDLLRSWAFGAAISLTVNFLVLPVKASALSRNRTSRSLARVRSITGWLLAEESSLTDIGCGDEYTPANVRRILHGQEDTLVALQAELSWEFGWCASDLYQRGEITDSVLALQRSLVSGARDGPFVKDLPEDLKDMVKPAVSAFADWAMVTLDYIILTYKTNRKSSGTDVEHRPTDTTVLRTVKTASDNAAVRVTDAVISALRSHAPSAERLAHLDRATHCLDATRMLTNDIVRLETLVRSESQRQKRLQSYILHTIANNTKRLFFSSTKTGPVPVLSAPVTRKRSFPFLTVHSLKYLTSPDVLYSLKVACALCCLLAILWAPSSRSFFLNFAVRNATVPLLLALMPTVGLSVMSWTGQLSGAILGILYACFAMRVWKGVGRNAYSVPGIFFFEWILCLAVGHRMLRGPDFLAVTSMNACAIFIVIQWQQTGLANEQSLALHLGYMLTTSAIAIALAIPFQLLIFPRHARDELRLSHAETLRKLAVLALEEVTLSSDVLLGTKDDLAIQAESQRLSECIATIKTGLRSQDGLIDMAAAEWVSKDSFNATRSHLIVETLHRCVDVMAAHVGLCAAGTVDERIRDLLRENNEPAAHGFAEACSTVFWCLGAAWSLAESPPAPLASIDEAGTALLREMEQPLASPLSTPLQVLMHTNDQLLLSDIRRWWSLTLTLVTQRAEIAVLMEVMSSHWRTGQGGDYRGAGKTGMESARPVYDQGLTDLSGVECKAELGTGDEMEVRDTVVPVIHKTRESVSDQRVVT